MKTIVGNWKMTVGSRESAALARGVVLALRGKKVLPEVIVCPSFVSIPEVRKVVARSHVSLGAQDMFWEETGAFTGATSPRMLEEFGVSHVILGHSERRMHLGETGEMVNKKVRRALESGLVPIVCVGETKEQRASGGAEDAVAAQVHEALSGARLRAKDRLLIAYEPVWAIGSGRPATPKDAATMHAFVRTHAANVVGEREKIRVLYGGSVDGENAFSFLRETEVDGVLVGSASVKLNQFSGILDAAIDVLEGQMSRE
jgi:triosephosphate isomerase